MSVATKGIILAAGRGERLFPFTEFTPKPLIPFFSSSPIELILLAFRKVGISEVAVNAHHLGEQVGEFAKTNSINSPLVVSYEREILGTGGCYPPLEDFIGDGPVVVVNGDIVSTIDTCELLDQHKKSGAIATMALLPDVIPGESAVLCQGDRVVGFGKPTADSVPRNFACAQVFDKEFLKLMPEHGAFGVIESGYENALKAGHLVHSFQHHGFWHDLRNPSMYLQCVTDVLKAHFSGAEIITELGITEIWEKRGYRYLEIGDSLVSSDLVMNKLTLRETLIEQNCIVTANSQLDQCVVWRFGHVESGVYRQSIITNDYAVRCE
jgi:mannose-1-phosphate guanylyltransferase